MKAPAIAESRIYFIVSFCLLILSAASTFSGHDAQRIVQVVIGVMAVFYLLKHSFSGAAAAYFDTGARVVFSLVFVLGLFSCLAARQPGWAMVELALAVTSCAIGLFFFQSRIRGGDSMDTLLIVFVCLLCSIKSVQFLASVLSAFSSGEAIADTDLLLEGFSNKRFYGQFQTFTLPLLAFPLLIFPTRKAIKIGAFTLLASWWFLVVSGGTRGSWLGMMVAASVLFFLGASGRRWVRWQLMAALVGVLSFWLLFGVIADYLGLRILNFAGDRLNSSLSSREIIWQQAWDMIRERPWQGFGPMHFADIASPVAAHPHQAVLQWASEWGVPSALCVAWLVVRGLFATLRLIRERADSQSPADLLRLCLFASLIGALTQSMIDGVIVMPYSQLWLALVVGWLMGLHVWKNAPTPMGSALRWGWRLIGVTAVVWLAWVVIRDVPHLQERNEQYARDFGGHFQPRFWAQGVIAQKHP